MRRYLTVANQTLLEEALLARVRECLAAHRLQDGLERFRALEVEVQGEVGDTRPIDAVRDAMLHAGRFQEIIVSTLPPGILRWLHQDLPRRIRRAFELPTSVVVAKRVAA